MTKQSSMTRSAKPSFEQVNWNSHSCLNASIDTGENLSNAWHYHPELELILVKRSKGTRIIGTSVETFSNNDLVLIGKNLPHAFLHEERYLNETNPPAEAMVIQFYENFLGNEIWKLSEFKEIYNLLVKSRQGICVSDSGKEIIIPLIEKIFEVSSTDKVIILLEILKALTQKDFYRILVNDLYNPETTNNDERFNKILNYTYANYDERISIDDLANLANLTRESFCRYFKGEAHKTYFEFLTAIRIRKACQMIRDESKSIKEIGYSCGFESTSNFYYQFKKIMKISPLEFKSGNMQVLA